MKIVSATLICALFLALPGGAIAQGNAGLDAYTENPPSAGGPDDGTSGADGTSDGSGTATFGSSTGTGVGDTSGTGSGSGSGSLTEAQAAAAGETPNGQLPATGLDETGLMALVGGLLLAAGFALSRTARNAE